MTASPARIVYFQILDMEYPRNRRIRAHLEALGHEVIVVPRASGPNRWHNHLVDALRLWRVARAGDVIVVAEMFTRYTPVAKCVALIRRTKLVVDGFIGIHETAVEDWGVARPGSLRALRFKLQDRFALRCADLYLIDTRFRAESLRRKSGRTPVLSLPVGAPSWARPRPVSRNGGPLRVLYYGGYIPLHGLDIVVDALAEVREEQPLAVTFIGEGVHRKAVEDHVERVGLSKTVRFFDNVPEARLADAIAAHDVVLGVFGSSGKAAGVIANKVWQGAASGRLVITRESPALAEISETLGENLVQVGGGDEDARAHALADALRAARPVVRTRETSSPHERLEQYVSDEYQGLTRWLSFLS